MSFPIVHETTALKHESGTKFYEVVVLHAPDVKRHLVIKRWGKTGAAVRGGEIQIYWHATARKAGAEAEKIITQKGGRGYSKERTSVGLHGFSGEITSDNLRQVLESHYSKDAALSIVTAFNLDVPANFDADSEANEIVSEEPNSVIPSDRGDSWGSW
jgi:predicted DNA-binding WGR domain protein